MSEVLSDPSNKALMKSSGKPERMKASELAVERVLLEDAATMISTIANNEAKTLTFAAMALRSGGAPLANGDIYRLFLGIQGDKNKAWGDIGHAVPAQYARTTFEPIAVVAKSQVETSRGLKDRFTVTKYGERIGLAAAGMMLDISLRYPDISLYEIFGKTGTSSKEERRSPFTRLEILRSLAINGDAYVSNSDLAMTTGLSQPSLISHQLEELSKVGLLEVRRFQRQASDKEILVPDLEKFARLVIHPRKSELPDQIHSYIYQRLAVDSGPIGIEDVIEHVQKLHPDSRIENLRELIHISLARWEANGSIETRSEFSNTQRSLIRINPERIDVVTELLTRIEAIMNGDQNYLDWGQAKAQEILSDTKSVNELMLKARESSPFKQRATEEVFKQLLISYLTAGSKTVKELENLAEAESKPTSRASIQRILRKLRSDGIVGIEQKSGRHIYSLIKQEEI